MSCRQLLTRAVSEQLIADVPLAVLLSGGVDSSLVTAIAAEASTHKVRTFTVTLPDHRSWTRRALRARWRAIWEPSTSNCR